MGKVGIDRDGGRPSRRSSILVVLSAVATACAWVFALGALGMLAWALWGFWPGLTGTFQVMSRTMDGVTHTALGLSYQDFNGTVLLIFEALLIGSAIVMSVLPLWRVRRVGHVLLILWVGLWVANAGWLASIDESGRLIWVLSASVYGLFGLCTIIRAARGWRLPQRGRKAARRARKIEVVPG